MNFSKLVSCFLIFLGPLIGWSQEPLIVLDTNGRYHLNIQPEFKKARRISQTDYTSFITISHEVAHPWKEVEIIIDFPLSFNLERLKLMAFNIRVDGELQGIKSIMLSQNVIDFTNRRLNLPIGGLTSQINYEVDISYQYEIPEQGIVAYGDHFGTKTFNVLEEPANLQKRMLMVIDSSLHDDIDIRNKIDEYIHYNSVLYENIDFEKLIIGTSVSARSQVYDTVHELYAKTDTCLSYIFFIGQNASLPHTKYFLNYDNSVFASFTSESMGVYTQLLSPDFIFDRSINETVARSYFTYQNWGMPANDLSTGLLQSYSNDIAYGMLIPKGELSPKQHLIQYFDRLKSYKKGEISFNKSVLFADTQLYDGAFPQALEEMNLRWSNNDTINVNEKRRFDHWYDPNWRDDYINKLSTKSYEIVQYMGHGAFNNHYHGISLSNIGTFNKNALIYDFTSCAVGNYHYPSFLAAYYLENGKGLFVKSYSTNIYSIIFDYQSPLLRSFQGGGVFDLMDKGLFWSDAYLYGEQGINEKVLLGDPLLQFAPPCSKSSINLSVLPPETSEYWARQSITIDGQAEIDSKTKFEAGSNIILFPGTNFPSGVVSEVNIKDCPW